MGDYRDRCQAALCKDEQSLAGYSVVNDMLVKGQVQLEHLTCVAWEDIQIIQVFELCTTALHCARIEPYQPLHTLNKIL